jgi:hypothetical protein
VTTPDVTLTLTSRVIDPPAPEHTRENVLVAARAPVEREPDGAIFPAHAPLALHEVAPDVLQVRVADSP